MKYLGISLGIFLSLIAEGLSLLCYQCVSTHPGCGTPFKWVWYPSKSCPEENDVCVKIIEKKGVTEVITRDCLSSVVGLRTDIPADRYEGCRPAAFDPRLANYVNNSIKELDIKRDYYDSTTWCFCYFDHWCNSSSSVVSSVSFMTLCLLLIYLKQIVL
ncbi:unnamed protein product [Bemisia tabaci]|uniref:Protein sleepless n=1 Tax=Bemisia tabaci TaxID=7038 RepID=A0A9P0AA99_BEMTA|nr:PREDICTED: uncharacterized protein LOC109031032 [Bemisia tabaci]CAH0386612.1 unnamed protein product [Bemisia tabaci]